MQSHEKNVPTDEFLAIVGGTNRFVQIAGIVNIDDTITLTELKDGLPTGRRATVKATYVTSRENHCALSPEFFGKDMGFSIVSLKLD